MVLVQEVSLALTLTPPRRNAHLVRGDLHELTAQIRKAKVKESQRVVKRAKSDPKKVPPTGTSPSGKTARPACFNWLKGACSNAQCDFWHSLACRFFSKNTCEAGDKCKFQHVRPKAAANADVNISDSSEHKPTEVKAKVKAKAKAGAVLSIPLLVAASFYPGP